MKRFNGDAIQRFADLCNLLQQTAEQCTPEDVLAHLSPEETLGLADFARGMSRWLKEVEAICDFEGGMSDTDISGSEVQIDGY